MKKLIGMDYFSRPYSDLKDDPDYSPHAHRIIAAISKMTTQEIEQLDLIGRKTRGTS